MALPHSTPKLRLVAPAADVPHLTTDAEIVGAFEQGNPSRADQLYDHLIGVVQATLFRVLGQRDAEHDDLVQSVFEQIVITLQRGKYKQVCSLKSWAASISCHVALNALRSRRNERKVIDRNNDGLSETAAAHSPERQLLASSELQRLRRHLAQLSPDKARTLVLHDALGYDLAEIATLTGTSIAAAQSRLVRGRRELKQRLEQDPQSAREELA